ncbi:hypothetical protein GCM10011402_35530 [Paracoccus acridae]|uniref:Amicyanin n=1 Tax=Paracoccus acridae TaxID=1795310 RepID=A0ABQ1VNT9_9RHOB|nr:amicyanin [Paracoccus acridae]GGF79808.1 hypothetical protein GCM10011402_35530 [Paracoccus acridae]
MNSATTLRSILGALALSAIGATGAWAQEKITVPTEEGVAATEVPADAIVVNIAKMKYQTPELTIKTGDTVYWINNEVMPHNVAFKKGVVDEGEFRGDMLGKDEAYAITFNEAGTFDYFCTPHPFMRAKVIVE